MWVKVWYCVSISLVQVKVSHTNNTWVKVLKHLSIICILSNVPIIKSPTITILRVQKFWYWQIHWYYFIHKMPTLIHMFAVIPYGYQPPLSLDSCAGTVSFTWNAFIINDPKYQVYVSARIEQHIHHVWTILVGLQDMTLSIFWLLESLYISLSIWLLMIQLS